MFKFYRVKKLKPHVQSVEARLPEVYKKYLGSLKRPQAAVHYIPETEKYRMHPITKEKVRVENREIPLSFPKEADEGIWGGEGVIRGFNKDRKNRRRYPTYWIPKLQHAVVYSEILNEYMKVTVTQRTLNLIDENHGFDHYILGTPVQDLKSHLALKIRRKLLLALVNKEKYHKDEEKNKEVFATYEKYMVPKEEAEWFGLTLREAIQKQKLLEVKTILPVPLKHELRLKLIEELKNKDVDEEQGEEGEEGEIVEKKSSYKSWVKKLNPFSKTE